MHDFSPMGRGRYRGAFLAPVRGRCGRAFLHGDRSEHTFANVAVMRRCRTSVRRNVTASGLRSDGAHSCRERQRKWANAAIALRLARLRAARVAGGASTR
jgi:hypothetical protein